MRIHILHDDGEQAVYDVKKIFIPAHEGPLAVEGGALGGLKITQQVTINGTCEEVTES